jgi:hypothetical protein
VAQICMENYLRLRISCLSLQLSEKYCLSAHFTFFVPQRITEQEDLSR